MLPLGIDHVLFIIALCLSVDDLRSAILLASLFTLAHSITLAIGYIGWVSYNQSLVEIFISFSIFVLAIQNSMDAGKSRLRPYIIFVFGLIHGLGFASALREYGLVKNDLIISLVGFNLGVEIAQAIIILFVFSAIYLMAKNASLMKLKQYTSYLIATIALLWTFERIFIL